MNKYKILAITHSLVGALQILYTYYFLLVLYPKLMSVYQDFGAALPVTNHLPVLISFTLAAINLFLAYKVGLSNHKEKYFLFGIFYLVISLVLTATLFGLLSIGTLLPMFNLINVT